MNELELVRLVRPEVEDPSESTTNEARRRVLEIAAGAPRHRHRSRIPGYWQVGRRRWAVTIPAAAVLAAIVVAVAVIVPSNAPSAAAEVLLAAADRAEVRPIAATTTILTGGTATDMPGIRYTRWESASLAMFSGQGDGFYSAIIRTTRDTWVAPDGSGRIAQTVHDVEFLSDEDRLGIEQLGEDLYVGINDEFGPGELSYPDYESLPTDVDQLEAVLAEIPHGDWPNEVGVFWSIQQLLREGGTPAELRAALYRVAAGIDGIELLGDTTDRAGRTGTGVSLTYQGNGLQYQDWLIFDPDTTELLGEEKILLTATPQYRAQPPITVSWFVYIERDTVNDIP